MNRNPVSPTIAQDIGELMTGWNKIMAAAKKQFPNASPDELQALASGAMNHTLGINPHSKETKCTPL